MKVDSIDNKIIIYLRDINSSDLEELCRDVINKLNDYYNIELKGFYDVIIYIDSKYGSVLEFILEDLDLYYDYSKVDLHIIKKDVNFLYQVDDILDLNIDKFYLYHNKYYIPLDNLTLRNIEFGRIIYQNTNQIIRNGSLMCKE